MDKSELPFCSNPKKGTREVGFEAAFARDCAGYDPIVKDLKQKVSTDAPKSTQTQADKDKVGNRPVMKQAMDKKASDTKEEEGWYSVENARHARMCGAKHFKAGEFNASQDWCGLWNTAISNLVEMDGTWIPKSLAFQSSESRGEGGPNQFGFAEQEK
jgi:hypothetical protein